MATTNKVKTIKASCKDLGRIIIPSDYKMQGEFSISGNYADYEFCSPLALHQRASSYDYVIRNGKKIKGNSYTRQLAEKDFALFAK